MADTKTLKIVLRMKDLATKELKKVQGVAKKFGTSLKGMFKGITKAVFSLKGAVIGLVAALALRKVAVGFLKAGEELENFRLQLVAVMDGARGAAIETLTWVREFAARTPFMTKDVIAAFVMLKSVGMDVTKDLMTTIGDTAFVFNRNITDVANALVSRMSITLRPLGIELNAMGERAKIMSGKIVIETGKSSEAIRKGLLEMWKRRFPGAMKEAEEVYTGLMALIKSEWWEFQVAVMESGLFEYIKGGLKETIAWIAKLRRTGKFVEYAKSISDEVVGAVKKILGWFNIMRTVLKPVYNILRDYGREIVIVLGSIVTLTIILPKLKAMLIALHVVMMKNPFYFIASAIAITIGALISYTSKTKEATEATISLNDEVDDMYYKARKAKKDKEDEISLIKEKLGLLKKDIETINIANSLMLEQGLSQAWINKKIQEGYTEFEIYHQAINRVAGAEVTLEMALRGWALIQEKTKEEVKKTREEIGFYTEKLKELGVIAEKEPKGPGSKSWVKKMKAGWKDYLDEAKEKLITVEKLGWQTAVSMERTMSSLFFDAMTGRLKTAQDYFKSFFNSILKMISDMMAQKVMMSFLNMFFQGKAKADVGGVSAGIISSAIAGEKGGVMKGGLSNMIPAFQGGGITTGPTIGLIGEGSRNEAVVPLPDNKSIPVKLLGDGGGGVNITFNILANDTRGFDELLIKRKDLIIGAVSEAMRSNRNFRKTIKG